MAYNDIDVILYKILRYISECMKAGVPVDFDSFKPRAINGYVCYGSK